jgi:hypothetical protein
MIAAQDCYRCHVRGVVSKQTRAHLHTSTTPLAPNTQEAPPALTNQPKCQFAQSFDSSQELLGVASSALTNELANDQCITSTLTLQALTPALAGTFPAAATP